MLIKRSYIQTQQKKNQNSVYICKKLLKIKQKKKKPTIGRVFRQSTYENLPANSKTHCLYEKKIEKITRFQPISLRNKTKNLKFHMI